jgi:transposase
LFVKGSCAAVGSLETSLNLIEEDPIMTISPECEAQILRYFHVEKWPPTTIARQLNINRGTVKRVLARAGLHPVSLRPRPSRIDPFLPFIHQILEKFPRLAASRLYVMVHERGYRGSPHHFRHLIACLRPRPQAEAFLRLRSLPGEQAQVDWAHFGHLAIGRARRPLMAFVMVLSYSRYIFLRFFLNARMENFLRGHVGAFEAWSGVPKVVLYDYVPGNIIVVLCRTPLCGPLTASARFSRADRGRMAT